MSEFTSLVNKATTPGPMEDWDTILQICEILVHRPDESSTPILDAIDQKMRSQNIQVQMLALTLLDACIKNSSLYFHKIVSQPNRLSIVHALGKSNNAEVRARANELLQEWQPIFRKASTSSPSSPIEPQQNIPQPNFIAPVQSRPRRSPAEKRLKLEQDLKVVHETVQLLLDFINAAQSPQELKQDSIQQVVLNCDEMHRRLVALIERVPEEGLLLKLIEANEELCAAMDYYDTYKKTGAKNQTLLKPIAQHQTPQTQVSQQRPIESQQQAKPIDLDDIFTIPSPQYTKPTAPSSDVPLSLDDLLNMPSRTTPGPYGDSMARELQNVEQEESSSAFGVLARRHNTPSAPVFGSELNTHLQNASNNIPKQTSPNPFDFDVSNNQQSIYPQQSQLHVDQYVPQQQTYAPQQSAPSEESSGYAVIAKRKNDPSRDFSQYLDSASKPNQSNDRHDSPF
jgi:hypothetical protein